MPTCVGFGTGRNPICARSFSWKLASCASLLARAFAYLSRLQLFGYGFACMPAYPRLAQESINLGSPSLLRHSITCITGTGISACFPSTTPFGLALGPDLPRADEPSPGILGLSVCRILTCISLLTPAFSLPCSPRRSFRYGFHVHATLPYHSSESTASVSCLAPVHFRRRVTRLVSCYALFKGWLLLSQPPSCLGIPTSFST